MKGHSLGIFLMFASIAITAISLILFFFRAGHVLLRDRGFCYSLDNSFSQPIFGEYAGSLFQPQKSRL